MTGLAQLLKAQGKEVSGSDTDEQFFTTDVLKHAGLECYSGFDAKHLDQSIDIVVRSTAYDEHHVEVAAALQKGLPVLTYPEALGQLTQGYRSIAVCGSHGKTTTTALLAHILEVAKLHPSALIGSQVLGWQGNALTGSGELFVFEADEYQNKFQYFSPQVIVLTSIDWDHPDFFATPDDYYAAFVSFLKRLPTDGVVVACYDDPKVKRAVGEAGLRPEQIVSYGLQEGNWCMVRMWLDEGRWHFSARQGEEFKGDFWLKLIGSHNVANALAAVAAATRLGVDLELTRQALASFEGTSRRLEQKGKLTNGVTVVDDYAHHPTEIAATLKALRAFYPYKHLRCVFQPHTFSRTEALLGDFAKSFSEADEVVLLKTYASARDAGSGLDSEALLEEVKKFKPHASYVSSVAQAAQYLATTAGRSDLVVTMGAGDVWQVGEALVKQFGTVSGSEH
jgi:UDP-N-acetylmuramate--alanine ligase